MDDTRSELLHANASNSDKILGKHLIDTNETLSIY